MLIEVMVGALVLAITTTAVLNGLDGAQKTGGRNKARSVAAALAEQDQERMRSMPVADLLPLVNTPYTRPVAVKGATYTVTSSASYATDPGSASTGCSATAKTQTNLRILSSVTSPSTRGTVDVVGLVTPPASSGYASGQGRLIVKVFDRDDVGIANATVALSGTGSFSEETNASGCAVFPFVPSGNYTAAIEKFGHVGWDGEDTISKAVTATAGQTTTYGPYYLEQPATINAQFDTRVASTTVNAKSRWITVNNPKLLVQREVFDSGAQNTTVPAAGLFPFLDGYGIYAGQCTTNNPGGTLPNTTPNPGATLTTSPKIRVPSINVRVVNSTSTSGSGPAGQAGYTMVVKPAAASGCNNTFPTQTSATVNYGGTNYAGVIPEPGYPYGTYTVCAQRVISGAMRHAFADVQPYTTSTSVNEVVTNTNANGNSATWNSAGSIRIFVSTAATIPAGQSGPCP